jgi:histidine triad (HIT) family protein
MSSIFTKIINREIPAYIVAEDDNYIAFLDVSPLQKGHTLVIPKNETDFIFDVADDELTGLILFSKKLANKINGAFDCNRVGMSVIGLEVPHAHIHLIPINKMEDMMFNNPRLALTNEDFLEIQSKIVNQ